MLTKFQRRQVAKFGSNDLRLLDSLWEQRRRWWFAHLSGREEAEAKAAALSAKLHAELIERTAIPDGVVRQWEREWDAWFEDRLKRFMVDV